MAKVTGVGGVFLQARGSAGLGAWYAKHLGVDVGEYGGEPFCVEGRRAEGDRDDGLESIPNGHDLLR